MKATLQKLFILLIFLAIPVIGFMNVSSPPTRATGAPNESLCTGCHSGTPNSGSGVLSFSIDGNPSSYTPGKLYTFRPKIMQEGVSRFGFEMTVLAASSGLNGGQLSSPNTTLVSINSAFVSGNERFYAGHTTTSSAASTSGVGEWTINWRAPSKDSGAVKIYVAANASNNDGKNAGDQIYNKVFTFNSASSSLYENKMSSLLVYPSVINHNFILNIKKDARVNLLSLYGKKLEVLSNSSLSSHQNSYLISGNYPTGVYLLEVECGSFHAFKKILINQE